MYVKRIVDKNIGPISKVDISPSFSESGNPKPIIFVGKNGSGKSTLISNIVDSFFEFAGKGFNNALQPNESGFGHTYFKIISGLQIKAGKEGLYAYIEYDNNSFYVFKSGNYGLEKFKSEIGFSQKMNDWKETENFKKVHGNSREEIQQIFKDNVLCYFGPERYEKPVWMGDPYYNETEPHLLLTQNFVGHLENPIKASFLGEDNLSWLLDIIVDSRTDVAHKYNGQFQIVHNNSDLLIAMGQARENIEQLMSAILEEEVYFGLNLRGNKGARFNIKRKEDDSVVAPTMDSLSTGQLALFNLFSTIIRYADRNDMDKSIHLSDIKGIVVIDEIELHLHTSLQKEVLPQIIKLFPKVQFIITTHSPLFLLGMRDVFTEEGFDIYELPDGRKINVERFSEFERAYDYFSKTSKHDNEIMEAIKRASGKALVITEGPTDWKHMLAAYNALKEQDEYKDLFDGLDFDFFKYESSNNELTSNKLEMGNKTLTSMCEAFSKLPQKRKIIFVADRDVANTNKKMSENGSYKCWGNNVYSFILPVPKSREQTPDICIEHYYSDSEIKTEYEINGIRRRLYMGNEFDDRGISKNGEMTCRKQSICGDGKINIIDGSSDERVTTVLNNDGTNYALSKMKFAELVLNGSDKFDFSNFVKIFEIIKEIITS